MEDFERKMAEKSVRLGIVIEIIKGIYENAKNYYVEFKDCGNSLKTEQKIDKLAVVVLCEYRLKGIRPVELARILGVDYNVVHQWIRYGKVDWWKDDGKLWVKVDGLIDGMALDKKQKVEFLLWLEAFYILLDNSFRESYERRFKEAFDLWTA